MFKSLFTGKTGSEKLQLFALLALPWVSGVTFALMTAVQSMADAFTDVPYNAVVLVSTLPNLTLVASSLFAGFIVGKKLRLKTHILISACVFITMGALPAVLNNFTLIAICRAVFGLGFGLFTPISNSYIFLLTKPEDRPMLLGVFLSSVCVAQVVFTLLAGVLCSISWRYAFLVNLIAIIPLIFVTRVLPNPPKADKTVEPQETEGTTGHLREKNTGTLLIKCLPFLVLSFMYSLFCSPVLVSMSSIIQEGQLGSAATAGVVLAFQPVTGIIAGLVYGTLAKCMKKMILPFLLLMCAIGMAFVYIGEGLFLIVLGSAINAFGGMMLTPAVTNVVGRLIKKEGIGLFTGFNQAFGNLGFFAFTGLIAILTGFGLSDVRSPVLVSSIFLFAITIIVLLCVLAGKKMNKSD